MSQTAITKEQKAFLQHVDLKQQGGVASRFHMAARKKRLDPESLCRNVFWRYYRDANSEYFKTSYPEAVKRGEVMCRLLNEYQQEALIYAAAVIEWESLTREEQKKRLQATGLGSSHMMKAKRAGKCSHCGFGIEKGEWIFYNRDELTVMCKECGEIVEYA